MTIPQQPPELEVPERREPGIDIPPDGPTPDLPPPEFPDTNEPDYRAPGTEEEPLDLPRENQTSRPMLEPPRPTTITADQSPRQLPEAR